MKKKQITIIALALVLAVLVLLYIFVVAPLLDDDTETEPMHTQDGEGLYFNKLAMYPEIDANSVSSITVKNEHGEYTLENKINEDTGKKRFVISGYPYLVCDDMALSYLSSYSRVSVCSYDTDEEPLRNCTDEQMLEYGVTADACTASYTIRFTEGGEEKSYTVYIGQKTLTSDGSYFASVKGRNHIYKIADDIESCFFLSREDYVNPLVCSMYTSGDVVYQIERLSIGKSNSAQPFIGINTKRSENEDSINVKYSVQYPLNAKGVVANSEYISNALTALYVSFTGDKVVEIDPDEQTCKKYGLGGDDVTIAVSAKSFSSDASFQPFVISQKRDDGYYYVLVPQKSEKDTARIVRVPSQGYEFLEEDNSIKWVATNSVDAGFSKYISANESSGESGVKEITIKANTTALKGFEETFILTYTPDPDGKERDVLTVTTASGKYTFKDNTSAQDSTDRNQFNNFYAMLVSFPAPNRFNTMSTEEQQAIKAEKKLLFSLRVTLNDGTKLGYDYYEIDAANAMCEFFDDAVSEPRIVFDTTVRHIDILANSLKQLINGEKVEWN